MEYIVKALGEGGPTGILVIISRRYTDKTTALRVKTFLEKYHPKLVVLYYDSDIEQSAREIWNKP